MVELSQEILDRPESLPFKGTLNSPDYSRVFSAYPEIRERFLFDWKRDVQTIIDTENRNVEAAATHFEAQGFPGSGIWPGKAFVYPGYSETDWYATFQYVISGKVAADLIRELRLFFDRVLGFGEANALGITRAGDLIPVKVPEPPRQKGGFVGLFDDFSRGVTGLLTLGLSEIKVSGRRLGQQLRLEPFISTTLSGGFRSSGNVSATERKIFETGGKVVTGVAVGFAAKPALAYGRSGFGAEHFPALPGEASFVGPVQVQGPPLESGSFLSGGSIANTPSAAGAAAAKTGTWETLTQAVATGAVAKTFLGGGEANPLTEIIDSTLSPLLNKDIDLGSLISGGPALVPSGGGGGGSSGGGGGSGPEPTGFRIPAWLPVVAVLGVVLVLILRRR